MTRYVTPRVQDHFLGDGCATHADRPIKTTVREIAEQLEIEIKTVQRWAERRETTGFPDPVETARPKMKIPFKYDWDEVDAWYTYWRLTRRSSG